jgi:hypothetical protein
MSDEEANSGHRHNSHYEPNFVLPNHDVIHEDNWEEFRAKGFVPTGAPTDIAAEIVGIQNVYTGDAWDNEAVRPLRHKAGKGEYAYLGPEAAKRKQEVEAAYVKILRQLGVYGPDDPATN